MLACDKFELSVEIAEAGGIGGEFGDFPMNMVRQHQAWIDAIGPQGVDDGAAIGAGKHRGAGNRKPDGLLRGQPMDAPKRQGSGQ